MVNSDDDKGEMKTNRYRKIVEHCGTPTFIYSEKTLKGNVQRIKRALDDASLADRVDIYAAYFTNSHPRLFEILAEQGIGATLQGVEEYHQLHSWGLKLPLVVSPTCLSDKDLEFFLDKQLQVNVSLPEELEYALQGASNTGVRLDLSAEQRQRTGLKIDELDEIKQICRRLKKQVHAIHTYPGTGSNFQKLVKHAEDVFKVYKKHFSGVKEINLGGGFAFDYDADSTEDKHFPWREYFAKLASLIDQFQIPNNVRISIEPGRDIFADAGEFLVIVNKFHTMILIQQVYTDGSYVFMPSATIRERQHNIRIYDEHFREVEDRSGSAELNGCTTLSSDFLFPGIVRAPVHIQKGSYILVQDIGAYGSCQHMEFLNKRPAAEVLVTNEGVLQLITESGNPTDKIRYALCNPKLIG